MSVPPITLNHAVFLDIDGTLLDLAATPDDVVVPDGLPAMIFALRHRLGGALAILSGRKLADIDILFGAGLACAAEHGAVMRDSQGHVTRLAARPARYDHWLRVLSRYAQQMPGVLIEEKELSLVVHYRRAPEHEAELSLLVERLIGETDDAVLLLAHCAFEMKPRGGDKGTALATFMKTPLFAGRVPLFVGDDVTDEPAMRKANELGGAGLHVARDFGGKTLAVRNWLAAAELIV